MPDCVKRMQREQIGVGGRKGAETGWSLLDVHGKQKAGGSYDVEQIVPAKQLGSMVIHLCSHSHHHPARLCEIAFDHHLSYDLSHGIFAWTLPSMQKVQKASEGGKNQRESRRCCFFLEARVRKARFCLLHYTDIASARRRPCLTVGVPFPGYPFSSCPVYVGSFCKTLVLNLLLVPQ